MTVSLLCNPKPYSSMLAYSSLMLWSIGIEYLIAFDYTVTLVRPRPLRCAEANISCQRGLIGGSNVRAGRSVTQLRAGSVRAHANKYTSICGRPMRACKPVGFVPETVGLRLTGRV